MHKKPTIVVTRPEPDSASFKEALVMLGYEVFMYSSIEISKPKLSVKDKQKLINLNSYDWILFTSRNGVSLFLSALQELEVDRAILKDKKIGAVGPATASALAQSNISVDFVPGKFTTFDLAAEMPEVEGKKILLPRANIASATLRKALERKGAFVTEVPIYKTVYISKTNNVFEKLVLSNMIAAITVTSPSTIRGLVKRLSSVAVRRKVQKIPLLSIGPVTSKSAKGFGFETVYTAKVHTIEGLLAMVKEKVLD